MPSTITPTPLELVITLGPASLDRVADLAAAGATQFRLNASHMTPDALRARVDGIFAALPEARLVVDLQGGKMRLGPIAERSVARGERLVFTLHGESPTVLLPHPECFAAARPGLTLSCDDGRLHFRVLSVAEDRLEAEALESGPLRPRKGVNLLEHPVRLTALTAIDRAMSDAAGRRTSYAYSFMQTGEEVAWVKGPLGPVEVAAKIECREAIDALPTIAAQADSIWICRGDLGEQLGPVDLARFVATFDPRACPKPVLMAGQVLHSLCVQGEPSRSELCHLYDLLARGYAGIVLSDETAIGVDPLRATRRAAELLDSFGRSQVEEHDRPHSDPTHRHQHGRR